MADHHCLQSRQSVAAAGIAAKNRELVPDELAAAIGEDGRKVGETCPVLLVAAGGKPFDETFICQHAGADRWTVASVGRNPKTGARVEVPSKTVAYFKPGKELKAMINATKPEQEPSVALSQT